MGQKAFQSTPSVGRATFISCCYTSEDRFQSTPSVGRATDVLTSITAPQGISIHALRGEGDRSGASATVARHYFNPRPPWGGRQGLF